MKKFVLIMAALVTFAAIASAQPRSIGLRVTDAVEATYQHTTGPNENFVELDLGYDFPGWFNVAAIYDFMIVQPNWTSRGEWGFYAGPGLALGAGKSKFAAGLAVNVGLEYTFWFPLQLAFDVRPEFGYCDHSFNCWAWYPALSVRYRF